MPAAEDCLERGDVAFETTPSTEDSAATTAPRANVVAMRETVERLLRDATLVTLALALALGWTLVLVGQGLAETVTTLLTHYPQSDLLDLNGERPLTWAVGGRILSLSSLVSGLIAFALVFAVAVAIDRRTRTGTRRR